MVFRLCPCLLECLYLVGDIALRASGASWRTIGKELGVGIGTARRAAERRAKIVPGATFDSGLEVLHV